MTWEGAPLPPGLPPGYVPESGGPPPVTGLVPWEDPSAGTEIERLWITVRDVFAAPGPLFDRVPSSDQLGRPIVFGMIMTFVAQVAVAAQDLLFGSSLSALTKLVTSHHVGTSSFGSDWAFRVGIALGSVILYPLGLLVGGAFMHACLALFGAANRPMTVTMRAMAYTSAASLVALVPFAGPWVSGIVHIVLEVVALSHAHRASTGRVVGAVLLPVFVTCACIGLIAAAFTAALLRFLKTI